MNNNLLGIFLQETDSFILVPSKDKEESYRRYWLDMQCDGIANYSEEFVLNEIESGNWKRVR